MVIKNFLTLLMRKGGEDPPSSRHIFHFILLYSSYIGSSRCH